MKAVKIRQGTSGDRVVVTFDSGETLRMSKLIALDYGVSEGAEIEDETGLRDAVRQWSARERAVRIVSASNVSQTALLHRLVQKGESEDAANDAVQWLGDLGLVDDRRAGEAVVQSALAKGYGAHRIRQMLYEKEIPRAYWEDLLSDLPPMDAAIDRLLRQRLKSSDPDPKEIKRAVDALLRFGHSWEDIKEGLRRRKTDWEDWE